MDDFEPKAVDFAATLGIERFFSLSSDMLCIVDGRGRYVRLSDSWRSVLGYCPEEVLGRHFIDLVHPDDVERTLAASACLGDGGSLKGFVNRLQTKEGNWRSISWNATAAEEDGLVFAVARDITELIEENRALAIERARLRAIMDTMPDLVFMKDRDFRYVACNKPFQAFMGHTEAELVGRDDFQFFDAETAQSFRDHDVAMLESGHARRNNEWVSYPDGARRFLDTLKVPFHSGDGEVLGVLGISRDITEQSNLRGENEFFGQVMNASRDAIYCVRSGGDYPLVYVNDAACALLGARREDILGKGLGQFAPSLDVAAMEEMRRRLQGSSQPFLFATELVLQGDAGIPVEVSASRVQHDGRDYLVGSLRDITVRREVEARLKEREALYRAAIEASSDGFWLVDGQGSIIDSNSAYTRMSGYSLAELRTMRIGDLEAVEDDAMTRDRINRIIRERILTFESHHRRKDRSIWEVEVTVLYSEIEGGRFFVFLRDLRNRRVAEMLLKARLRLSDIGRSGNIDALMTEVLDSAERLTGSRIGFFHFVDPDQENLTLQAWSTNTLANMCSADGKGLHYPVSEAGLWADSVRNGQPLVCNDYAGAPNRRGMPDGHAPVTRLLAVPVPAALGFQAVIGVGNKADEYGPDDVEIVRELAVLAMDIVNWLRAQTQQKALSEALAATAREWSAAMDSFKGGVAIIDPSGRLARANTAFFALTRSDPGRRLGRHMTCLADFDGVIEECQICEALARGEPWHAVIEPDVPRNPSGVPLEVRLSPIGGESGGAPSLLLSLYDLSETRQRETQMRRTIEELANSNAELERFAQVAAHDLQEPTRRQVLYAQLLQRLLAGQLDEEKTRYFGYIMDGALRMRDMVRELHTYADERHAVRADDVVDLDLVLEDVRQTLCSEIESSHALMSADRLGQVAGSRHRMKLLFSHLLTNALKFRRPGVQLRIRISAASSDGWLEVGVEDNGIGIPEKHRTELFALFRRLHGSGEAPGLGMGLAQCRHVVESLGGRIWIDGNDAGGTTVRFTLPRPAGPQQP